jgi:hypothetical protein
MSAEAAGKGDPLRWHRVWSIGIYAGPSPFELAPAADNPVLTARDVSDADAYYVADPFMLRSDDGWHMYFEVLLRASRRGVIGHATSQDARAWRYRGIVLDEPFHLAYPQVFTSSGVTYMLPETIGAKAVRLYQATGFPGRFAPAGDLIEGVWADPTIYFDGGMWWLLACSTPFENRTLHLFHAEQLLGPWHSHPLNPIVPDDRHSARPGGRVFRFGDRLIRLAQDCVPRYGTRLRAIEITDLGVDRYAEKACSVDPLLAPAAQGWNSVGMHHMDAHALGDGTWIACVDGDTMMPAGLGAMP